jgi:RNA polymerase primary sigma factor
MRGVRAHRSSDDSSALKLYLKEIGSVPLLSAEEEIRLAKRVKKGDEEALRELVEANLRFVVSIAKRYANIGLPLADLINEGNMGLMKAARRFDCDRGFRFISYAVWWIRQSIMQAITEQSKVVRLPANKAGDLCRVEKAFGELSQRLGRSPTVAEVASGLGMDIGEIEEILKVSKNCLSLETPIGDEGESTLIDLIADDGYQAFARDMKARALREEIEGVLKTLSFREERIIKLRFGLEDGEPLTLEEIGRRLGLTKERVRQIEDKAIKRLRRTLHAKKLRAHLN